MALEDLKDSDRDVIRRCLQVVTDGSLFDDAEFHTLFGVHREQMRSVLERWPDVDDSAEDVSLSINNSLVNLLGYPHGRDIRDYVGVDETELHRVLKCWRDALRERS